MAAKKSTPKKETKLEDKEIQEVETPVTNEEEVLGENNEDIYVPEEGETGNTEAETEVVNSEPTTNEIVEELATKIDELGEENGEKTEDEEVEEEVKMLNDTFKELEESKEAFDKKINANPEKAEEIIKQEIKKVKEIKNKIKNRSIAQHRMTMLWNGQDFGG